MRHALLLLSLCACTPLSTEEHDQLANHIRNAKYYYEGGRLGQAMGQIERGLELEPDNYTLLTMRGTVLLRQSGSAMSTDHQLLDQATESLQAVYEMRSPDRHEPSLLLTYALALQKQGRRHKGEALRLRDQATRAPDKAPVQAQADAEQEQATELLGQARAALQILVERGETLRAAHNHLLQIAQDLGDETAFAAAATAYLAQCEKDQKTVRAEIERTTEPNYEAEQVKALAALRSEELDVRSLLAEHDFSLQRHESALVHLNRVLELDPQRTVDYYNRGRVLLELKRSEEAKADFRKFLAMPTLPASADKRTLALRALDQ